MIYIFLIISIILTFLMSYSFIYGKKVMLKNKISFINKFKSSDFKKHEYTITNYKNIKKWVKTQYPNIDYIEKEDLNYASVLFRENKESKKYKLALKGKEDIYNLKKEIEFDTYKECFQGILINYPETINIINQQEDIKKLLKYLKIYSIQLKKFNFHLKILLILIPVDIFLIIITFTML